MCICTGVFFFSFPHLHAFLTQLECYVRLAVIAYFFSLSLDFHHKKGGRWIVLNEENFQLGRELSYPATQNFEQCWILWISVLCWALRRGAVLPRFLKSTPLMKVAQRIDAVGLHSTAAFRAGLIPVLVKMRDSCMHTGILTKLTDFRWHKAIQQHSNTYQKFIFCFLFTVLSYLQNY